jgi:glycerophosphoryl diester phosphodiesterase
VPLGLLVVPALDTAAAVEEAAALGCSALHLFHLQVTSQLVDSIHDRGMAVVTWTVNDPRRVAVMLEAGVDAIISDDVPEALRAMGVADGLARDGDSRGESGP